MAGLDLGIVVGYFVIITVIGVAVSRRASGSIEGYFLGGRNIPWYILGISGMATFVDISGTAFQVGFFYLLGAKGFWICWQGAIALGLAFFMIFMGKWLTRSGAMTNAEWMTIRFGAETQGRLARFLSAFSILIIVIAFLGYFFVGAAKVLPMYVPIFENPKHIALLFFVLVGIYTVSSGFHGVVVTDVIQGVLMFGLIIFVAVKAMIVGTPEYFAAYAPAGWLDLWPETWTISLPEQYKSMEGLGILLIFWIIANVLQGFAMPFDAWTSQRYYAAKDERESSLIAGQWISLFSFRFLLMAGFGVLALSVADKIADPEMALAVVIKETIPTGVKGLLLAGLIAAAMSTLDSFVNSSAAYFVRDIYQEFINPKAEQKRLVKVSYITTAVIMVVGIILGWNLKSIGSIWGWIVMGLFTGTLPPNIVKWYWWRFNGAGFAGGMISGMIAAVVTQLFFAGEPVYITFIVVLAISSIGTIVSVFLAKPTEMETLVTFYKKCRPFGFWSPVRSLCDPELVRAANVENRRDLLLLAPTCIWQIMLFWMMTAIVLKKWTAVGISAAVVVPLSLVLYKFWYKNLKGSKTA